MALKVVYNQERRETEELIAWKQFSGYSEGRADPAEEENAGSNTREDVPAGGDREFQRSAEVSL